MEKKLTKEEFDALPKNEQIVYLAEDVLKQLELDKFVAAHHGYFNFSDQETAQIIWSDEWKNHGTAQNLIEKSKCYVCAKGAVVCSFILNFNNRSTSQLNDMDPEIVEIFGLDLWTRIEQAYEGWDGYAQHPLEEIMQNIIDNNGELTIERDDEEEDEYYDDFSDWGDEEEDEDDE